MSGTAAVAAVVLAAGRGTRFGQTPKLLAELDGKPLVRHAVEAALGAGLPTLVVVGHAEPEIRAALLDLPVTILSNPAYADGLSTSLKAGFAALPLGIEGALILLGDMPRVRPGLLRLLVGTWESAGRPAAVVPISAGRRGNPALISRRLSASIGKLTGDSGAGPLLRSMDGVVEIEVADQGVLLDIDTTDALATIGRAKTAREDGTGCISG